MYKLTKTQKDNKFLYEVKDENGNTLISRVSNNPGYVAVMICKENETIYVPNYFFGRLDLIGKGDSKRQVPYQIGIAVISNV